MKILDDETSVSFAITADSGELQIQARLLVQSIRNIYSNAPILVFVPESSLPQMDDDVIDYFDSAGHLVTGKIPIPEYPISALIQAFVAAESRFDTEYLVALDTDTLVLDYLRVRGDGDVWLRPVDVGAQYWASDDAWDAWSKIYRRLGYEPPGRSEWLIASVDGRPTPPYWNSGVVITTDHSLPARWLEYTKILYYEDKLPVSTREFFIDQLSLAIAVRENTVSPLSERENYPLGGRLLLPSDVTVLHYGDRRNLARVLHRDLRDELRQINAIPSVDVSDIIMSFLVLFSTKCGIMLPYDKKEQVRQTMIDCLPSRISERQ